jgi:hypothetical protein
MKKVTTVGIGDGCTCRVYATEKAIGQFEGLREKKATGKSLEYVVGEFAKAVFANIIAKGAKYELAAFGVSGSYDEESDGLSLVYFAGIENGAKCAFALIVGIDGEEGVVDEYFDRGTNGAMDIGEVAVHRSEDKTIYIYATASGLEAIECCAKEQKKNFDDAASEWAKAAFTKDMPVISNVAGDDNTVVIGVLSDHGPAYHDGHVVNAVVVCAIGEGQEALDFLESFMV